MASDDIKHHTIVLVDDDDEVREMIREYLLSHSYDVISLGNGKELDACLQSQSPDLVILDVMMPGEDGLSIARRLRPLYPHLPILMLSGCREETDRIVGLEIGADMYLTKPISLRELLAHIRVLLRRSSALGSNTFLQSGVIDFGSYSLNYTNHKLWKDGQEIPLTEAEYNLLALFAKHPNRVLSRDELMNLLRGYDHMPYDRSIDVRISRLRAKLGEISSQHGHIRTIRGAGYMFCPQI